MANKVELTLVAGSQDKITIEGASAFAIAPSPQSQIRITVSVAGQWCDVWISREDAAIIAMTLKTLMEKP